MYTIRIGQDGVTDLQWWPGSSTTFGLSTQQGNVEVGHFCMHEHLRLMLVPAERSVMHMKVVVQPTAPITAGVCYRCGGR